MIAQYNDAINAPPNQYEQALLSNYSQMRTAQDVIAGWRIASSIGQAVATASGGIDAMADCWWRGRFGA